jgi:hypothetical protein
MIFGPGSLFFKPYLSNYPKAGENIWIVDHPKEQKLIANQFFEQKLDRRLVGTVSHINLHDL